MGVISFCDKLFAYLSTYIENRHQNHATIEYHREGVAKKHDCLNGTGIDVEKEDFAYFCAEGEQIQRRYQDDVSKYQRNADSNNFVEILMISSITI